MIALWSPRSFYGPRGLIAILEAEREAGAEKRLLPESKPLVPTIVLVAGVLYSVFQWTT